jgi:hypothetical protein
MSHIARPSECCCHNTPPGAKLGMRASSSRRRRRAPAPSVDMVALLAPTSSVCCVLPECLRTQLRPPAGSTGNSAAQQFSYIARCICSCSNNCAAACCTRQHQAWRALQMTRTTKADEQEDNEQHHHHSHSHDDLHFQIIPPHLAPQRAPALYKPVCLQVQHVGPPVQWCCCIAQLPGNISQGLTWLVGPTLFVLRAMSYLKHEVVCFVHQQVQFFTTRQNLFNIVAHNALDLVHLRGDVRCMCPVHCSCPPTVDWRSHVVWWISVNHIYPNSA